MNLRIAVLNGSLGGAGGNTGKLLGTLAQSLRSGVDEVEVDLIHLAEQASDPVLFEKLAQADGFVFATGTYWDSWGSPMQRFLEAATGHEGTSLWLGKPASVLVTMHATGGKGVLSRLQGNLSAMGLMIPPMSGMVYSLANHLALETPVTEFHSDLWCEDDLRVIGANLLEALRGGRAWTAWPVDRSDPTRLWV